jgi:hypothetical protein
MTRKIDWPVQSRSILRSRRAKAAALLLVVLVVTSLFLIGRPAHLLPTASDQFAWLQAVDTVSREGSAALNTCVPAAGDLSKVPGLGPISSICTWGAYHGRPLKIRFVNRAGDGLLFMTHQLRDWTLQLGYCSYPLGGPWYQLAPSSQQSASCPRGFSPLHTP